MKIAITTETTCDLSPEQIAKNDIKVLPLTVILGEKSGLDGIDITPQDIFDYAENHKDLPRTSAVNEFTYEDFFKGVQKDYDAIIHIALSSGLSSSCENAINVSKRMNNVYVIDSLNLSTGIGLQVLYACELRDKGLSPEEIVKKVEARRSSVQASFFVNTIDYLYKGGRCSKVAAFGAIVLRIKPQILVQKDGTMVPGSKYFGRKTQACKAYCEDVKTLKNSEGRYEVTYIDCEYNTKISEVGKSESSSYTMYTYQELETKDITYYRYRTINTVNEPVQYTKTKYEESNLPDGYVKLDGSEEVYYSYKYAYCEK